MRSFSHTARNFPFSSRNFTSESAHREKRFNQPGGHGITGNEVTIYRARKFNRKRNYIIYDLFRDKLSQELSYCLQRIRRG